MQNWLFGLLGQILCEQSAWLLTSLVSPFLVYPEPSMPFKYPCMAYALFPERLSNQCQSLRHTLSEICTKCDVRSLSVSLQDHIRRDTRLQINGHKKSARPPNCMKFCTLTPKIC
jgi:hypothetical protein